MPGPFEELASLDRLVHEPARLALLTALSACRRADFMFLLNVTGLTKGNLSSHLGKLERAGLVTISKHIDGMQPVTYVELTRHGRAAIDRHWDRLNAVRKAARTWKPATVRG